MHITAFESFNPAAGRPGPIRAPSGSEARSPSPASAFADAMLEVYFFFGFGLLFTVLEQLRPARRIDYRAVLAKDLGALVLYQLLFAPGALYLSSRLVMAPSTL